MGKQGELISEAPSFTKIEGAAKEPIEAFETQSEMRGKRPVRMESRWQAGERVVRLSSCLDAVELLNHPERNTTCVLLFEIRNGESIDLTCLRRVRAELPDTKIFIHVDYFDLDLQLEALNAGADGFLVEGSFFFAPSIKGANALGVRVQDRLRRTSGGTASVLTAREREVMSHVSHGQVDKEIAASLKLSVLTVKRHLHNIYTKLGVGNRVQAMNRLRGGL